MDATDDQDITLQKSAPELIFKLKLSIPRFLWKSELPSKAHTLVLKSKTDQLIQLVGPPLGLQ